MSGSEARVRNYRMTARLDAKEKQKFVDLVKHMGFKSEGDFLRVFVLGSKDESSPRSNARFKFSRQFQVYLEVHEDGRINRRSEKI